ncbi:MAG: hypothetical protein JWO57_3619 [Pseudonocardiales bacterium]|nr:hypothetical protein [Pseudonocardiales bacterium]
MTTMSSVATNAINRSTGGALGSYPPLGMAMRFSVTVDGLNLGHWHSCKGLNLKVASRHVEQGGQYIGRMLVPERVTFDPITLERAMHPSDSKVLQAWLKDVVSKFTAYKDPDLLRDRTATIELLDHQLSPVADWKLTHVYPIAWSGPSLGANENRVAMESLVLDHEGFLDL